MSNIFTRVVEMAADISTDSGSKTAVYFAVFALSCTCILYLSVRTALISPNRTVPIVYNI